MTTSSTLGHEYIKVILQNKRMVGAILIGDTDLEVKNNFVVFSFLCGRVYYMNTEVLRSYDSYKQ